MAKLDWEKLRRNERVHRDVSVASSDTVHPVSARHEMTSAELIQLADEGRLLLSKKMEAKLWLRRYSEFERRAHHWSSHPEINRVYAQVQQRHSVMHGKLASSSSEGSAGRLTAKLVRFESLIAASRSKDVSVEALFSCHELFERLAVSLASDHRVELLVRFRRVVGFVGVEKIGYFIEKKRGGGFVDPFTVLRWLNIVELYAPVGPIGASLKESSQRLRDMSLV